MFADLKATSFAKSRKISEEATAMLPGLLVLSLSNSMHCKAQLPRLNRC